MLRKRNNDAMRFATRIKYRQRSRDVLQSVSYIRLYTEGYYAVACRCIAGEQLSLPFQALFRQMVQPSEIDIITLQSTICTVFFLFIRSNFPPMLWPGTPFMCTAINHSFIHLT